MDLSGKTKIDDLLREYPFLIDFFIHRSPKFKNLKDPIMRKTIGKVATLNQVAALGKIELDELMREIACEIREKTNQTVAISPKASEPLSDPKATEEILKGIIRDLHKGEDMESLKRRFRELIQDVSPSEIANMEQRLKV